MCARQRFVGLSLFVSLCLLTIGGNAVAAETAAPLRAGTATIDITPEKFPVKVVGGFLEATATSVHDRLYARCLVLDDGKERLAIVVADSCALPRDLLDHVKASVQKSTGIRADRILIAATHTHSGPATIGALGTSVDETYRALIPGRLVQAIEQAAKSLAPARVGWAVADATGYTNCRQWIHRPDKMDVDPFGERTVRVMMHPGYQNPAYLGPSGPVDSALSMLAVQSPDGRPIALLANFSMHYFGAPPISADYFGLFVDKITKLIGASKSDPPFVAMMSQGTAGDQHWMDYGKPAKQISIDAYSDALVKIAHEAYKQITYHDGASIAMAEKRLVLNRRVPDEKRLAWAKGILANMKGPTPTNKPEVYAREQVLLAADPTADLKLQALRIGELGIVAIPCEVFGITGMKIKAQSPLQPTFNIELANGSEGYIPPPDLHPLGGYTTWPARSAGLEVQAEPKIVDAVLGLLEEVSGKSRRPLREGQGAYPAAVLASKPLAYWRMSEPCGPRAADATGNGNDGTYEVGLAYWLEGPESPAFSGLGQVNRAPHFAGGRMVAKVKELTAPYTVEMWFCNYLPADARPVTGYVFSRGQPGVRDGVGDHLCIDGTHLAPGKLLFWTGGTAAQALSGKTVLREKTWHHIALVRDGNKIAVYLDGASEPEIAGEIGATCPPDVAQVFIGGRCDGFSSFEGRIDEVAVYGRALPAAEIAAHYGLVSR